MQVHFQGAVSTTTTDRDLQNELNLIQVCESNSIVRTFQIMSYPSF